MCLAAPGSAGSESQEASPVVLVHGWSPLSLLCRTQLLLSWQEEEESQVARAGSTVWSVFISTFSTPLSSFREAMMGKVPPAVCPLERFTVPTPLAILLHSSMTPGGGIVMLPYFMGRGHVKGAATSGREPGLLRVFFLLCQVDLYGQPKDTQTFEEPGTPRRAVSG